MVKMFLEVKVFNKVDIKKVLKHGCENIAKLITGGYENAF
jgi:hypothetical protein